MQSFEKQGVGGAIYRLATRIEGAIARLKLHQISVGGLPIAYLESMTVRPRATVLLLHGFSAEKSHWVRFAKYLSRHFRLLIPDLAGHGATPYDESRVHSVPNFARDMLGFLDALEVERADLAGNSMGGQIAARIALDAPDRVRSLGLFNPSGVTPPKPSGFEALLIEGIHEVVCQTRTDFRAFYDISMHRKPFLPGFVIDAVGDEFIARRHALTNMSGEFFNKDLLQDELAAISCPAMLIWGREDRLLDVSAAQIWQDEVPGLQAEIWDGIGHMPMLEDPKRTGRAYRAFLEVRP